MLNYVIYFLLFLLVVGGAILVVSLKLKTTRGPFFFGVSLIFLGGLIVTIDSILCLLFVFGCGLGRNEHLYLGLLFIIPSVCSAFIFNYKIIEFLFKKEKGKNDWT
ncbi:MAG: hypothetical protein GY679_01400 [Mycoplasma sp.]|nr:hypothetical protein [Mycoplasma sp.]